MLRLNHHYYIRSTDKNILVKACCGGVVSSILKYLLDKGIVDLVIAIKQSSIYSGKPVFITDSKEIYNIAGSFTVSPINIAKLLRDYVKPDERVALTLKPCEEKAVEYLVGKDMFKRENMFLIGLNCGGLIDPFTFQSRLMEMGIDPSKIKDIKYTEDHIELILTNGNMISINYVEGAKGLGLREACRRCLNHVPSNVDVACGYWGLLPGYEKYTYTIPMSEKGVEILNNMEKEGLIEVVEAPKEGRDLRSQMITLINRLSSIYRSKSFEELDRIGLEKILSRCIMCLECWHACPIRSEKEIIIWEKKISPILWQVSVISYMYDKCVECGSCEDVCPMKIPFSLIISRVRSLRKELGV